jgi:hypothetical protein
LVGLGVCVLLASCYDYGTGAKVVAVDGQCRLVDASGSVMAALDVANNDLIAWTNNSDAVVKVVVTDPDVLSGRTSLRLEPGEKVVIRVAGFRSKSLLQWYCGDGDGDDDDDDDKDGGSGGNTPVNNGGGSGGG